MKKKIKILKNNQIIPLILASKSPARKQLLEKKGVEFTIFPSQFNEKKIKAFSVEDLVNILSYKKAEDVKKHFEKGLILALDTLVSLNNKIIGKPKDDDDARRILTLLSGSTHKVVTGITIWDAKTNANRTEISTSKVKFKELSNHYISKYIASKECFGKAGAFSIQGEGGNFIQEITGDKENVIGLPFSKFLDMLKKLGYNIKIF